MSHLVGVLSRNAISLVLSAIISLLVIHFAYGLPILDFSNINWLMSAHHDWGTHYLGWAYFKDEPWTFPLCDISGYNYPVGTNIGFTDSIPLLALLFKPLAGLFSEDFQYFGLWLYICHLFTAFYTFKILKLVRASFAFALVCAILMCANPVLIFRGLHPALCTQWLIMASIYYYLIPGTLTNARLLNIKQGGLLIISALVNPYITAMIIGFTFILPFKQYYFEKVIELRQGIKYASASLAMVVISWILIGMIEFNKPTSIESVDPFSLYSFNLNAFFNAYGDFSSFIPDLGRTNGLQYEGFAYLGVGIMILIVAVLIVVLTRWFMLKRDQKTGFYIFLPLVLLVVFQFLFAITNEVSWGTKTLFTMPLPGIIEKLGFIFRASGRFVWPLYYLVILSAMVILWKFKIANKYKIIAITVVALVQFYDIENLIRYRELPVGSYETPLSDRRWINTMNLFKNVIVVPSFTYNYSMTYNMDYQDYCYLALKAGRPVSNAYVARANNRKAEEFRQELAIQLSAGEIGRELFITLPQHLQMFDVLIARGAVGMREIDKFIFVYAKDKESDVNRFIRQTSGSKRMLDSIASHYRETVKLSPTPKVQKLSVTEGLQFNIDNFTIKPNLALIRGWAMVSGKKDNSRDSIFVALTSENKLSYVFPAKGELRPDISSVYQGKLDNAGFSTPVSLKNLPKGSYRVGILVKEDAGNIWFSHTDKRLQVTD